jgi:hypothetical protein
LVWLRVRIRLIEDEAAGHDRPNIVPDWVREILKSNPNSIANGCLHGLDSTEGICLAQLLEAGLLRRRGDGRKGIQVGFERIVCWKLGSIRTGRKHPSGKVIGHLKSVGSVKINWRKRN